MIVSSPPYNQGATTRDDDRTGFLDLSPHEQFQLALRSLTHSSSSILAHGSITPTKDPRSLLVCSSQTRHRLGSGTVSGGGKIFRALQALSQKAVQTVTVAPTAFETSAPHETLPAVQMASSQEPAGALPIISSTARTAEAAVTSTLAVQVSKQATTSKSSFNTSKFRGVTKHRHTGELSSVHASVCPTT